MPGANAAKPEASDLDLELPPFLDRRNWRDGKPPPADLSSGPAIQTPAGFAAQKQPGDLKPSSNSCVNAASDYQCPDSARPNPITPECLPTDIRPDTIPSAPND